MMQNVTIVGLGLIGGSLGLSLKRWSADNDNALRITGFDTNIEHQQLAKKMKAVEDIPWGLPDAISNADVVILAIPVGAMKQAFEDIAPHLKFNAIVTDTGSTKADVLEWAKVLPAHVSFVGAHPMAGGSSSLESASADLFDGASWIICPASNASELAIQTILGIVAATNGEPFFVEPEEHDAYVAGISHLPFVVASALVKATMSDSSWRDMKSLASTGFRDTTRVALGSPEMHRDIVLTNRKSISRWIDSLIDTLQEFKSDLANEDDDAAKEAIGQFFKDTQDLRIQADLVRPRSAEMAPEDSQPTGSGMIRSMLFGGFGGRDKDAKTKR